MPSYHARVYDPHVPHISIEDMDTAMGRLRSDTFKEATRLAKVTSRRFYLAQP